MHKYHIHFDSHNQQNVILYIPKDHKIKSTKVKKNSKINHYLTL